MGMNSGEVKKGGVSQEEGHATEVIQLKVYRPLRPDISASVNEKFCHNVNEWDPPKGVFRVQFKPINPEATVTRVFQRELLRWKKNYFISNPWNDKM